MARVETSKKKKTPRVTELSRLKKELERVSEQLESRDRSVRTNVEIGERSRPLPFAFPVGMT